MFSAGRLLGRGHILKSVHSSETGRYSVSVCISYWTATYSLLSHYTETWMGHKLLPITAHEHQKPITNLPEPGDILLVINFFQRGVLIMQQKKRWHNKTFIITQSWKQQQDEKGLIRNPEKERKVFQYKNKQNNLLCDLHYCSRLPAVWRAGDQMNKGH